MTRADALRALKEAVEAGVFPADTSARDLGIASDGLPIIKSMYAAFSGSLDAAKALHEAVLPGWDWGAGTDGPENAAAVRSPNGDEYDCASETCARAWLLAILAALIAQEEAHD